MILLLLLKVQIKSKSSIGKMGLVSYYPQTKKPPCKLNTQFTGKPLNTL